MIEWHKLSKEDVLLIGDIVQRARAITDNRLPDTTDMDISACHITNPLRLQALLDADNGNFMHDIGGIISHINRETGKLMNCFSPRYSA